MSSSQDPTLSVSTSREASESGGVYNCSSLEPGRSILIRSCRTQIYLIIFVEGCECLLLVTMAYDRYVAICRPLHYPIIMRWSVCYMLTALIFIVTFLMCILPSLLQPITLCHNQINHFMCELLAFVKLSCSDISASSFKILGVSFLSLLLPFMLILVSYICILNSVLKIQATGRSKALSTCSSHLAVVGLYFGTTMLMYLGPASQYSTDQEKYSSIFYVIVSPMLNPFIYSLNNRDIKKHFTHLFGKAVSNSEHVNLQT
ncbi:olfactory receptor 2A7-like [Hyperolius riggenbachi]|uniref:olfactory receptor 2A7-like n=1 Tax=Hyperolius riggenbachi TaxID=752182 RepID=UPI0035A360C3